MASISNISQIVLRLACFQLCSASILRIPLTRQYYYPDVALDVTVRDSQQAIVGAGHGIPNQNIKDHEYITIISIGIPAQTFGLFIDTTHPSTWVVGSACKSYICAQHRHYNASLSESHDPEGKDFTLEFAGYGKVKGHTSIDYIWIGGLLAGKYSFGETDDDGEALGALLTRFDGALGLGLGRKEGDVSVVQKLADQGEIDPAMFSLFLSSGERKLEPDMESELLLGGVDEEHVEGKFVEVLVTDDAERWEVEADGVAFGNEESEFENVSARFDSVAAGIGLPYHLAIYLENLLGSNPGLCARRNYLPDLSFKIGGRDFNLTAYDYITEFRDGSCGTVFWVDEKNTGDDSHVRLGMPFLRRWVSVYDFDRRSVSLGKARAKGQ